jgi:DNA polymerase-3 subunit gamma/tau
MSYQVLARKWRPKNFTEVAGQAHVLKSLINALENKRLHHAYLFTGTRGVGKTTLARILAKCLNCETGITSTPCEKCDSCVAINEGRFIDLIEVDAASRTKVEDTRELLENVQYTPSHGRYKVYLIDEVHMLSNHSFNALLKTLEEPPPHVKFLFATTDPQKLPVTILSRCLQLNLKNLSPQIIVEYLTTVLEREEVGHDEAALWQIAAAAAGSMRDALTLTDQAISYCEGEITDNGVVEMLGVPEQRQVYELLDAMASGNIQQVISLMNVMAEQTPDFNHTLDSLLSVLHRIAILQVLPDATDNSFGDKQQIQQLASRFAAEDIQLYYQIGLKGREELSLAAEVRTAFEMLIIRMLVFSPNYVFLESGTQDLPANSVADLESQQTGNTDATQDQKKKHRVAPERKIIADNELVSSASVVLAQVSAEPSLEDRKGKPAQLDELLLDHERWLQCYPDISVNGIAANILANTELKKATDEALYFALDQSQSSVYGDEILPKLAQILSDFFGRDLTVHITVGTTEKETPAELAQRLKQERDIAMVSDFEQDENVQELLKHFSGTLAKDSIAHVKIKDTHD